MSRSKKLFMLCLLFLSACSGNKEHYAPKHVQEMSILLDFTSLKHRAPNFKGNELSIDFFQNLVFKASQSGSSKREGSYTYNRINSTSSRIQLDLEIFKESQRILLELIFTSPKEGKFYMVDALGLPGNAEGHFTLSHLQMSAAQNEAHQIRVVFFDDTEKFVFEQTHPST